VQFALPVGSKLGGLPGDVEYVGGGPALRVNQAHLDVAPEFGERRADVVKKPWAVQGDDFHNRAVRGAFIIEMDPRFHLDFRSALFGLEFPFHQAGHVEVSGNGGDQILFQANGLGRIVIEGVETVREAEDIQDGSGLVRAGIRLQNIHSQDEIVPATFAKRNGRSVVTRTSS